MSPTAGSTFVDISDAPVTLDDDDDDSEGDTEACTVVVIAEGDDVDDVVDADDEVGRVEGSSGEVTGVSAGTAPSVHEMSA